MFIIVHCIIVLSAANNYHNVVCVVIEYPVVPPTDNVESNVRQESAKVSQSPESETAQDIAGRFVLW